MWTFSVQCAPTPSSSFTLDPSTPAMSTMTPSEKRDFISALPSYAMHYLSKVLHNNAVVFFFFFATESADLH